MSLIKINPNAKPFVKWAGGKTQLLPVLDSFIPQRFRNEKNITYIEPFVGGGALLFFLLKKYPNISRAVINDINPRLTTAYTVIRDHPHALISSLSDIQDQYRAITKYDDQKEFFLNIRKNFNQKNISDIEDATYLIFLNRTCFNGLYRENLKGEFNVPFGRYTNPTICDEKLILADSEILQKVEILTGDFSETADYVDGYTFFYFDPPYKPLNSTSNFNTYVKYPFNDHEQIRLRNFYSELSNAGYHVLMSNSDCKSHDMSATLLEDIYKEYLIERVSAKRCISANSLKRGLITELLIRNYEL